MIDRQFLTTWPDLFKPSVDPCELFLEWRPPKPDEKPRPLIETVGANGWADFGDFSTALKKAGVLDNRTVNLPGALVILPFGIRLVEQFCQIVRQLYVQHDLQEYDYPFIVPLESFEPVRSIFPLDNRLLHIGTDIDFQAQKPRATLCPTGEEVIYSHWEKIVRSPSDLPIKMYRRARFFRPASSGKRSGRSVFRPMEAGDVFEFHCCYATSQERDRTLPHYLDMLRKISEAMHVPTLWSTRPSWTNHHQIAEWAIGGDVPLPSGATVQTACLYNQGQIFSKAYGIGFKQKGEFNYTHHVTGAITRRLLLAHLMLGMDSSGALFIHPDIAPDQVAVVFQRGIQEDAVAVEDFISTLQRSGIRTRFTQVESRNALNKERHNNRQQGIPLEVVLQGRRHPKDTFKLILTRADTWEEAIFYCCDDLKLVLPLVQPILHNVGVSYYERVRRFFVSQCQQVSTTQTLRDAIAARYVGICPIVANEAVAVEIGSWGHGEILGYACGREMQKCALTGELTDVVAFVSPRI